MDMAVDTKIVDRTLTIDAAPETVWSLLTDPKEMVRWMGTSAKVELRRGGAYSVDVVPGHTAQGTFVEIDRPRRLVYTWGWTHGENVPPGSTTVIFELERKGNGTILRFEHRGLPTPDSVASHTKGWTHYTDRLVAASEGRDPGVDPWIANPGC